MKKRIRLLWWRVRAFFDRRYKSPVTNRAKFGKQTIVFLGCPKKWSHEFIRGEFLYQLDERGTCRGMIHVGFFEELKKKSAKEEK